jgi:hypothetical protein
MPNTNREYWSQKIDRNPTTRQADEYEAKKNKAGVLFGYLVVTLPAPSISIWQPFLILAF